MPSAGGSGGGGCSAPPGGSGGGGASSGACGGSGGGLGARGAAGGLGGVGGGLGGMGGGGGEMGFSSLHLAMSRSGRVRHSSSLVFPYQSFASYRPSYASLQLTNIRQSFSQMYHSGTGSAIVHSSPTTGTAQNVPSSSFPALNMYVASGSGSVACASPIRSNRKFPACGSFSANARGRAAPAASSIARSASSGLMPSPMYPYTLTASAYSRRTI